jgi:hypothetical protein
MRLFSYTIPFDDGAAPNPFHGFCTLAICKPSIRRVAARGDWVAGLGSINAPSRNLAGSLVYAMRVEEVITLAEYDRQAPIRWPAKIPNVLSPDLADRLGDCIYDYSAGNRPRQRLGVHNEGNIDVDLSGENVLIGRHFFYFGRDAIPLPNHLRPIIHQGQGHKSDANDAYAEDFVAWIQDFGLAPGQHGWPDMTLRARFWEDGSGCSQRCTDSPAPSC